MGEVRGEYLKIKVDNGAATVFVPDLGDNLLSIPTFCIVNHKNVGATTNETQRLNCFLNISCIKVQIGIKN